MSRFHYSPRGRYLNEGGCAECARRDSRSSALETELFYSLRYILGGGERDVRLPWDGRSWLDMRFTFPNRFTLGVEYDGAYWHHGRKNSDAVKSERVVAAGLADVVIRVREAPLSALSRFDFGIRSKLTGADCAQAVVLHAHHLGLPISDKSRLVPEIFEAAGNAITAADIRCRHCRQELRRWGPDAPFAPRP